jgi:hypothetical protein
MKAPLLGLSRRDANGRIKDSLIKQGIKKSCKNKLTGFYFTAPLPVKISNRFHQDLHEIYKLSEFIRIDSEMG